MDMDGHIMNPVLFQRCLRSTKLGKTPGLDGLCNEILRYLPEQLQQTIHKLFMLIWLTDHTFYQCKQSASLQEGWPAEPLNR